MDKETLRCQLDEILVLESIYGDDFAMTEEERRNRDEIQEFVDGIDSSNEFLPLQFMIGLSGHDPERLRVISVKVIIPEVYPERIPTVDISGKDCGVSRGDLQDLELRFRSYLEPLANNGHEGYLFDGLEWLDSQIEEMFANLEENSAEEEKQPDTVSFSRVWMYFHHIYSSKKRRYIVELAHQMKLTGICKSGKPGIICIEGETQPCEEYVQALRSLTWKRMTSFFGF